VTYPVASLGKNRNIVRNSFIFLETILVQSTDGVGVRIKLEAPVEFCLCLGVSFLAVEPRILECDKGGLQIVQNNAQSFLQAGTSAINPFQRKVSWFLSPCRSRAWRMLRRKLATSEISFGWCGAMPRRGQLEGERRR
jgi:hypothetical protein